MRVVLFGAALGIGLTLHGCGGDTPTPPEITVNILNGGEALMDADAQATRVGEKDQFTFNEGPVWVPDMGVWLISDVVGNKQYQYSPETGVVETFRDPSNKSNGMILDNDGSLLICEHVGRRVIRMNLTTREITTVADMFNNSKLTSPNDIAVLSSGAIYFTDPDYGTDAMFGHGDDSEQMFNNVFRVDPTTKAITSVRQDFVEPNGIAFSSDEKTAYIADSGDGHTWIRKFDVDSEGCLTFEGNSSIFVRITNGVPDGIKVDSMGNVWSTSDDGVAAYSTDGEKLVEINVASEKAVNFAWGGDDGTTMLFVTGTNAWTIPTKVTGAPRGAMKETVQVQV